MALGISDDKRRRQALPGLKSFHRINPQLTSAKTQLEQRFSDRDAGTLEPADLHPLLIGDAIRKGLK